MKYRAEIDGLRALAVVPVILFHAGFELFSGGFVGVDVFFIISGYLITTILIEDLENNRFSLVNFYERRARRILPALTFVMLVCIPFAWMWMLPSQMKDFSHSLVAVSIFASNILFWRESGYFAAAAEEKPLLHTWSLAVEEQYYVLFPIFLFFAWRYGKNRVFWMIVVLASISLALSEWGWRKNPSANFYLAPTRAWELFAGSIAAFIVQKRGVQSNNPLSLLGLAAIVFAIFAYDKTTPFPSVYALVPVVGVVLLVLYASKETFAAKLLSTKVFVGIGLISYSAYLWHQPLFAFSRIRFNELSIELALVLSAASIILGYLSWQLIEKPFRNKTFFSRDKIFLGSTFAIVIPILLGLVGIKSSFFEDQFRAKLSVQEQAILDEYQQPDMRSTEWRHAECFITSKSNSFEYYNIDSCLKLSDQRPNVLLIGDSHAAQWYPGLLATYPDANFLQATASGCLPSIDPVGAKRCTDLYKYIFGTFLKGKPLDAIILTARWDEKTTERSLATTLNFLSDKAKDVYLFGPIAEYTRALPLLILGAKHNKTDINMNKFVIADKFDLSDSVGDIARLTKAHYIPVIDIICPQKNCRTLTKSSTVMAFDYGHVTIDASRELIEQMKDNYSLLSELPNKADGS